MSGEWHGGKGSGRRPMSVSQEEWNNRWDAIFQRDIKEDNTGTSKNEYYDILTTEDALRSNEETQQAYAVSKPDGSTTS